MLRDTTDPLHDTVIMPIGGYTHGRGFKVHAYRFNNCKEKQKQKNFKKKEKQPNARCICTVSLLHCTLEGGLAAPSPHPANQGQNPTSDVVTRTLLYSAAMAPPPMATAARCWDGRALGSPIFPSGCEGKLGVALNPLQYSCLENPRDRGAWWAAVYGVIQS